MQTSRQDADQSCAESLRSSFSMSSPEQATSDPWNRQWHHNDGCISLVRQVFPCCDSGVLPHVKEMPYRRFPEPHRAIHWPVLSFYRSQTLSAGSKIQPIPSLGQAILRSPVQPSPVSQNLAEGGSGRLKTGPIRLISWPPQPSQGAFLRYVQNLRHGHEKST